jgi:hypothetical protein
LLVAAAVRLMITYSIFRTINSLGSQSKLQAREDHSWFGNHDDDDDDNDDD